MALPRERVFSIVEYGNYNPQVPDSRELKNLQIV